MNQVNLCSYGNKKPKRKDTRNDWTMFMFVSHCRFNVFRKESTQKVCEAGLRELESFGFRFGPIGFGGTHVHLRVDVPKRYSKQDAEIMLKRSSAARIFREIPGFLKRYPDRHFWSGYEHHESIGMAFDAADAYIMNQEKHHDISVIRDAQATLVASGDTAGLTS